MPNPQTPQQHKRKATFIDLTTPDSSPATPSRVKRARLSQPKPSQSTALSKKSSPRKARPKKAALSSDDAQEERRLRKWRTKRPAAYLDRYARAMSQRMFVLDRTRSGSSEDPKEELVMAGTTGNLYTVTISLVPLCTCPDSIKGNQCKHIIYSLSRILKAPDQLQYQLAFLSSELRSIFASAPLPSDEVSAEDADAEHPSNRKPITGDCPVCFCEMDDDDPVNIVWCRAACGNNIHKDCFKQWAKSSRSTTGGAVRCVYCRADWEARPGGGDKIPGDSQWAGSKEDLAALRANAVTSEDGYANIADELGLDAERDTSTYHQPWVRGRTYSSFNNRRTW